MVTNVVNILTFIKQLDREEKWRKLSAEDEDENMFQLFSYKCFRRTQYVTPFV